MTLVPHNSPGDAMTFDDSGAANGITIASHGRTAVQFAGARLSATVSSTGEPQIDNPDSITVPGTVVTNAIVRGDKAMFAWSSPDVSVILEQPRSMPTPSFEGGTIHLETPAAEPPTTAASRVQMAPVMDRCRVCGTHPNSSGDTDLMICVPGDSVCYRCISWECSTP
jgi:hypothetical protein